MVLGWPKIAWGNNGKTTSLRQIKELAFLLFISSVSLIIQIASWKKKADHSLPLALVRLLGKHAFSKPKRQKRRQNHIGFKVCMAMVLSSYERKSIFRLQKSCLKMAGQTGFVKAWLVAFENFPCCFSTVFMIVLTKTFNALPGWTDSLPGKERQPTSVAMLWARLSGKQAFHENANGWWNEAKSIFI